MKRLYPSLSLLPYKPLSVHPYTRPVDAGQPTVSEPYIVRFLNGRVNMSATFAGMREGQTILIRVNPKRDMTRIKGAAATAKVRIRISQHPAKDTILVTSLGPHGKRKENRTPPRQTKLFQGWRSQPAAKPTAKPTAKPPLPPDIFS